MNAALTFAGYGVLFSAAFMIFVYISIERLYWIAPDSNQSSDPFEEKESPGAFQWGGKRKSDLYNVTIRLEEARDEFNLLKSRLDLITNRLAFDQSETEWPSQIKDLLDHACIGNAIYTVGVYGSFCQHQYSGVKETFRGADLVIAYSRNGVIIDAMNQNLMYVLSVLKDFQIFYQKGTESNQIYLYYARQSFNLPTKLYQNLLFTEPPIFN